MKLRFINVIEDLNKTLTAIDKVLCEIRADQNFYKFIRGQLRGQIVSLHTRNTCKFIEYYNKQQR